MNGNGTASWTTPGTTIVATLRVLCNKSAGYRITFRATNATGNTASTVKNGSNTIPYTATLSTAGILNARVTRSSLRLNSNTTDSVRVNFTGAGNVLPKDGNTQANVITLSLTLGSSSSLYRAGTYTDVITTTVALQ